MSCVRFFVSGRVQGVFFRQSTVDEAIRLGLTGYAKNLPDGRVEVLACGDKEKLMALQAWLQKGPPLAQVDQVEQQETGETPPADFTLQR
jgi:acylphosphatase